MVDVGANVGSFSILAREVFPNAKIISIEPEPANYYCLKRNVGWHPYSEIWQGALAGGEESTKLHLHRHPVHSGGCFIGEAYTGIKMPFQDDANPLEVEARPAYKLFSLFGIDKIDILKIDTEGCEYAILHNLAVHRLLHLVEDIRFEWHGKESIAHLRAVLSPTHDVVIDENAPWNALGFATRKADG